MCIRIHRTFRIQAGCSRCGLSRPRIGSERPNLSISFPAPTIFGRLSHIEVGELVNSPALERVPKRRKSRLKFVVELFFAEVPRLFCVAVGRSPFTGKVGDIFDYFLVKGFQVFEGGWQDFFPIRRPSNVGSPPTEDRR